MAEIERFAPSGPCFRVLFWALCPIVCADLPFMTEFQCDSLAISLFTLRISILRKKTYGKPSTKIRVPDRLGTG
jgi:hypothetical protein